MRLVLLTLAALALLTSSAQAQIKHEPRWTCEDRYCLYPGGIEFPNPLGNESHVMTIRGEGCPGGTATIVVKVGIIVYATATVPIDESGRYAATFDPNPADNQLGIPPTVTTAMNCPRLDTIRLGPSTPRFSVLKP